MLNYQRYLGCNKTSQYTSWNPFFSPIFLIFQGVPHEMFMVFSGYYSKYRSGIGSVHAELYIYIGVLQKNTLAETPNSKTNPQAPATKLQNKNSTNSTLTAALCSGTLQRHQQQSANSTLTAAFLQRHPSAAPFSSTRQRHPPAAPANKLQSTNNSL